MNKHIKNSAMLLALSSLVVFGSCKRNFKEINTDPNNPSEVPLPFLLTAAQKGIPDNLMDTWWGLNVGEQLAQHVSSNQYSAESRYGFRTTVTNAAWNGIYAGAATTTRDYVGTLRDLEQMRTQINADKAAASVYGDVNNQLAVINILRAYVFQHLTDVFGAVPYQQAAQDGVYFPKYNTQEEVYTGIFQELEDALTTLDENADGPSGDVIYGGNMTKWKTFANSLKLRAALRIYDRKPALSKQKAEEAIADGVMATNADNALFKFQSDNRNANILYVDRIVNNRVDYSASNILLDSTLKPMNDPRKVYYFVGRSSDSTFKGEVFGLSEINAAGTPNSSVSQLAPLVYAATAPAILMDAAQVEFLLAEAAERGFAGTSAAATHYNNGITLSINFWSGQRNLVVSSKTPWIPGLPAAVAAADITTYLARPDVDYAALKTAGKTWKQIIGKQKWIALYMQGIEAWTEWRRLDFGILQEPADGVLDGTGIPMRMKYPIDEQTLNATSYSEAVAKQGADLLSTKVWWDVN